jgi:hypothetical protein
MSIGEQALSTRGLQASTSTARPFGPSKNLTEKWIKHREDLENVNLIPLVLPNYMPPLYGTVSRENVRKDLDYTLITAYP